MPVENQLLSGAVSEKQVNLAEEYEEEISEQDDYEDDEDYEDELEYVEINSSSEEINEKQKLYMDNDYSGQIVNQNRVNKLDEEKDVNFTQNKQSLTSFASKRPIQNANETLDIEPLDEKNFVKDNKQSENFEIDDPW